MEQASSLFHEKVLKPGLPTSEPRYRNALFHLLCCQTSCYRYWGQGVWTDYGPRSAAAPGTSSSTTSDDPSVLPVTVGGLVREFNTEEVREPRRRDLARSA